MQTATGGLATALSVLLAWGVGQTGLDMPPEIVAAVATVIGSIAHVITGALDGV